MSDDDTKAPRWLEYVAVDELVPDPRNPKLHADEAIDQSMERFGYTEAVVLDERTGMLVAGHGRRERILAAKAAGKEPPDGITVDEEGRWLVPVNRGWASKDDAEAGAYLVASNRLTEKGGWDDKALADIFRDLQDRPVPDLPDFDAFAGLGYESSEVQLILSGLEPPTSHAPPRDKRASVWEPDPPVARAEPVTVQILPGDSLELLKELPDNSVDAVVTDPPYGLEFMGKDWDSFRIDDRSARWAGDDRTGGAGAGFAEVLEGEDERQPFSGLPAFGKRRTTSTCRTCGKRDAFRNPHKCDADGSADWVTIPVDVVPVEMRAFQNWCYQWAIELYRVMKPGAHLLAFGGTRTYHRLASAIEDAGFDVRDSLHWMYANGFPKSLDIAKELDKRAGIWRGQAGVVSSENGAMSGPNYERTEKGDPVTDDARAWAGWGTALKPAHEPIVLARKPLDGSTADTVLKHGTGAINIDGTRTEIAPDDNSGHWGGVQETPIGYSGNTPDGYQTEQSDLGRWPANVIFVHAPECTAEECAPTCPAAALDVQSGHSTSTDKPVHQTGREGYRPGEGYEGHKPRDGWGIGYGDAGGASRFFPSFSYGADDAGMPIFLYVPKASTGERNAGLEGLEEREVNDALEPGDPGYSNPRAGAGRGGAQANFHPTVKPVALMRWLVRLVTPEGATVLDPFAGSGSTLVAAVLENRHAIGCEKTPDYLPILEARIGWAQGVAAGVTQEMMKTSP